MNIERQDYEYKGYIISTIVRDEFESVDNVWSIYKKGSTEKVGDVGSLDEAKEFIKYILLTRE